MTIRPSSLPMLSACPQWTGDESIGGEIKDAGTARHAALSAMLSGQPVPPLPPDEMEAVEWAAEYIHCHAPTETRCEVKLSLMDDDFNEVMVGTPDVVSGNHLFDLKWRYRDYTAQMAAYVLMMGLPEVHVHVLYGESHKAYDWTMTRDEAKAIVDRVIATAGKGEETPCDYCAWCSKLTTCPAYLERVNTIAEHREDWSLDSYHSSEIKTADEMGKALALAKQVKKWAAAVEHFAKEMVEKQGITPIGFKVQSTTGKSYVADVPLAFSLAGLPQEEFLKACELRLNMSKKYPDRVGASDLYAKLHGMKAATAKRTLKEKLADAIRTGASGIKLVPIKGESEEDEE